MNHLPATRKCSICKNIKQNSEFSGSQWKKPNGTGTCTACQISNSSNSVAGGNDRAQALQDSHRRTTTLIPSPQQPTNLPNTLQQQTITFESVPTVIIPQPDFNNMRTALELLRKENEELKKEKSDLMNKVIDLGLPGNVINELKDAEGKIKQLESNLKDSYTEIQALREENIELRKENNLLRAEISELKSELKEQQKQLNSQAEVIKRLKESFEVENRIAIRVLVNDAKKRLKEDDALYSGSEKKLLYNQAFTQNLNESAHVVSASRIKTAIDAKEDIRQRNCLFKIFSKTYPDYQEPDEEGDIWNELDDEVVK